MQKFGVQTEKGKVIYCWRNGDKYQDEPVRIVVHSTKFKTYDQLKVEFNKKVGLHTGTVSKVYSMDKKMIKNLEDFQDNHNYICCGAEKLNEEVIPKGLGKIFGTQEQSSSSSSTAAISADETSSSTETKPIKTPTTTSTTTTTTSTSTTGTSPSTLSSSPSSSSSPSPASITGKKPVVQAYTDKSTLTPSNKFSVGTEKAKVITAYRNGDRHHGGERVTIHATKFKTYDQLKEQLSKQVNLPTGSVRKVFSPDGKLVKNLEDFVDGQSYICCAGENLNTDSMPTALLNHH